MKSEGLSTKFLRTGGIVIITKQKNVTDKDKGGQKCNLTTETSYKMWQVRKQVREQLWKVRELVRKHKPKSSETGSGTQ